MKITIANKKLISKPQTNLEKAKYFKNIEFKTGNFTVSSFKKIVENGCTITYLYNDDSFNRDNSYMKNNYRGTQFICVDIDSCEINPNSFVESINYKPTLYHTTFSNLTPQKENKWCFHLIYCFDNIIEGEENFKKVFDTITEDYRNYVDECAKDCHRCIFTSNPTLENYIYVNNDIIYNVDDFLKEEYDDLDCFFDGDSKCLKNLPCSHINSHNNIQAEEKNETPKKNDWNLEEEFFSDLNSMRRGDFLTKYLLKYPYFNCSVADDRQIRETNNGIVYEDWRGHEYYEVPSKYRYINGKHQIVKIPNGNRTKSLMYDCLCFMKCIRNITKEYLVTMLLNEVYKYYDNTDGELNNYKILGIAKYGWNMKNEINIEPLKKKFKIRYSIEVSKRKAVGIVQKLQKDEEIGNIIDLDASIEENMKLMKEYGLSIKKTRLIQFCNDYDLRMHTDKEIRNNEIMKLYEENKTISLRQLEKLCKEQGLKISFQQLQRIIK